MPRVTNQNATVLSIRSAALLLAIWAVPATARGQIFVTNDASATIGEYTTSGATVNAALISGVPGPQGIAVSGANLFITNDFDGTIGKYTTSGATVNAALVSGLHSSFGIAVVPEPSTIVLACLAAAGLAVSLLRRRRQCKP